MNLLLLLACSDYNIDADGKDPDGFDTGGIDSVPVDTDDTDETGDSADTAPTCPDRSYPGRSIGAEACGVPGANPAWELEEVWSAERTGAGDGTLSGAVVVNLTDDDGDGVVGDEDDVADVVAANGAYQIFAFDGRDGAELWNYVLDNGAEIDTPAVGDLDGDGLPEIVYGSQLVSVALHGVDGTPYWLGPGPGGGEGLKTLCGGIGIADLWADGEPEVYFGAGILDGHTGVQKAEGAHGAGALFSNEFVASIAADMDLDGDQEVIAGDAAYDAEGGDVWLTGYLDGAPAIANFDADPQGEVVVSLSEEVVLFDDDGRPIWSKPVTAAFAGPPVIANLDGEGDPEIVIPGRNGVLVLDSAGNSLWEHTGSLPPQNYFFVGVSAYDLDGDGTWEVLLSGYPDFEILDGATGTVKASWATDHTITCGQVPAVADLDGDGTVEIVLNSGNDLKSTAATTVLRDTTGFVSGRPIWSSLDYAIVNVNDDGTIPVDPATNWDTYNNFRAGGGTSSTVPGPNLTPTLLDVCDDECAAGNLTVWYTLANPSTVAITTDVPVRLYGTTDSGEVELWSGTWVLDLAAGWEEASQSIELTGVPTPLYDLRLVADGADGADVLDECQEDDNEAVWGVVVCP